MKKSWTDHYAGGLVEKNLKYCLDQTIRINIVRNLLKTKKLPTKPGAELLGSDEDIECKEFIDYIHTDTPVWDVYQILSGYSIGRKRRVIICWEWVLMPFIRR